MKKRILGLALALCLALTLLPTAAFAATSGTCGANVSWSLSGGTLTIRGTGQMTNYGEYKNAPWMNAKRDNFSSVVIENGVTSIGDYAFAGCHITDITIPGSVRSIGTASFEACGKLTEVTLPSGVTTIGGGAFWICTGLQKITLPASVTSIGQDAFLDCPKLAEASYRGSTAQWKAVYVGTGNSDLTAVVSVSSTAGICGTNVKWSLENGVLTIRGTGAMANYPDLERPWESMTAALRSVVIENGVTSVGERAFSNCKALTGVALPASVTGIGDYAFSGCTGLTAFTVPAGVTGIGTGVLAGCTALGAISVSSGNTKYCAVDGVLFNGQKTVLLQYPAGKTASAYTIPSGVTGIGGAAFNGCTRLTGVTLPSGLKSIGGGAFCGCTSLVSAALPATVTSIGKWAFDSCRKLTGVKIPNGVTGIEERTFGHCASLTAITIPSSVKSIGYMAFLGCDSLQSVALQPGVEKIGYQSFVDCARLTSLTLPASVTSIGTQAFGNLTKIFYGGTAAQWNAIQIGLNNQDLARAAKQYNAVMPGTAGGFADVLETDWYAAPVVWAVKKGVTNGTSATTFSPNATCTQGQIITFLSRAGLSGAGTTANPFTNPAVTADQYYYAPLLAAYARGVVTDQALDPNGACKRSDVVLYLWRMAGSPSSGTTSAFTDVASTAAYAQAVTWAVKRGITKGTDATTFSPNTTCTRGQIVTFLYRDLGQ